MLLCPLFTLRKTADGDCEPWLDSTRSERRKDTLSSTDPNLESLSGIAMYFYMYLNG